MSMEQDGELKDVERRLFAEIVELPANVKEKLLLGAACHRSIAEAEAEEALLLLFNMIAGFFTKTWIGGIVLILYLRAFRFFARPRPWRM